MGNIAKGLRRSQRLQPVANMIAGFVEKAEEEERNKKLFDMIMKTKSGVQGAFDPRPNQDYMNAADTQLNDPFMRGAGASPEQTQMRRSAGFSSLANIPDKKVDYDKGINESRTAISDFLMEAMRENIGADKMKQAIDAIELLVPQKPKQKEGFTLGEGQQRIEFDESGMPRTIAENIEDYKPESPFKNFSARGYWDTSDPNNPKWMENKDYKSDKTNINVNTTDYDYSNQKGTVRSGIMTMKQIKNAKKNESGEYVVPNISGNGFITLKNYEDVTAYKEQAKIKFTKDAVAMVEQQGLVLAKDTIKKDINALIKKTKTKTPTEKQLDEVLTKFKKDNPQFDDADVDLLRNYFQFFFM